MIHPATMDQITCGQSSLSRCFHTAGNNLGTRPATRDDAHVEAAVAGVVDDLRERVHEPGGRRGDRAQRARSENAALVASYRKSNFQYEVRKTE